MNSVIANLTVMPENMMKNLNLTGGFVFSQRVLLELPLQELVEDAYRYSKKRYESLARDTTRKTNYK